MKASVTSEEVRRLSEEAGIALSPERIASVCEHLNNQLAGFGVLSTVDVTGVEPDYGGKEAAERL